MFVETRKALGPSNQAVEKELASKCRGVVTEPSVTSGINVPVRGQKLLAVPSSWRNSPETARIGN